jgi:hypothetical protein
MPRISHGIQFLSLASEHKQETETRPQADQKETFSRVEKDCDKGIRNSRNYGLSRRAMPAATGSTGSTGLTAYEG